jgi:hypothetical protein
MAPRKRLTDRQAAAGLRREISDDFKYDKKKLKHLKYVLHNVTVAVGTLVSALNEFSRVKGPDISPDGLLGGLGYIMPIKGIKEALNTSIHSLSDVSDSLADELSNPHWNSEDDKEVKELIKEKEDVEEKAEEVEESPEAAPTQEKSEEGIKPEEVKTSQEVVLEDAERLASTVNKILEPAVKAALIKFSSVGKTTKI